jgi:Clostripain family
MSATYTTTKQGGNEWTIMVFFAGEQDLSPSMTSQLKAIKDAGFQENTTVLIHYDPNKRGVGTVTFDINQRRKEEKGTVIGDGKDPFVRNLVEDIIPGAPKGATAAGALQLFLDNGLRNYFAKHFIVVLVGHGVIVGNDAFLPDDSPHTAITLQNLGDIFGDFSRGVKLRGGAVELLGMHSCSMSAIEVAYELKDTAKYMIATEGVSFVGSWPYRQMLKKILYDIDEAKTANTEVDVDELIMSLQRLCLHNSTDFMFSGLSADLCLCSLKADNIDELNEPLIDLTRALKKGLQDQRGLELITLAHLKAQSYWQETYTDLYDFCVCLERTCNDTNAVQGEMAAACSAVRTSLNESNRPDGFIVRSDFFGPLYQYSHGVSVYFPWSRPVPEIPEARSDDDILKKYENYKFTKALGEDSWFSFLEEYFKVTQRERREVEDNLPVITQNGTKRQIRPAVASPVSSTVSIPIASGGNSTRIFVDALDNKKASPQLEKASPQLTDSMGCGCSVKNYPMEFSQSPRASLDPNEVTESSGYSR